MIKITNVETFGWREAIIGMRNPMNSWEMSDTDFTIPMRGKYDEPRIGERDYKLMSTLSKAGPDHGKYLRMIQVGLDICGPLYWWKEFDTYKVGTIANSCSTMHKIHAKEFVLDDFSHEHLDEQNIELLNCLIDRMNLYRTYFLKDKNKDDWWQLIQLLPSSYNQTRTVVVNYQVLKNIYHARKNHKLDEWVVFCKFIESLPYSELITND